MTNRLAFAGLLLYHAAQRIPEKREAAGMQSVYLGIDQGTTGVTALALERGTFRLLGRGYRRISCSYPQPGWAEHEPEEIWQAVLQAAQAALSQAEAAPAQVACVGLDHEGETCLFFDRQSSRPLTRAVIWQDRRTEAEMLGLSREEAKEIRAITGLVPDAYFSASKLRWLLEHTPGLKDQVRAGAAVAGNLDSWLLCRMTVERAFFTDVSTASRTMLMNLSTGRWEEALLSRYGLKKACLPEIRDSACRFGTTDPSAFLGIRAPVMALLTDQQAALFGQGCFSHSDTKVTLGTGGFIYRNEGSLRPPDTGNVLATAAWRLNGQMTWALSGDIYAAGAAVNWLCGIGLAESPAQTEADAFAARDSGGLFFVPAFSGLASPYWDSTAGGLMIGLHGGTTRQQIVRAALESVGYQVAEVLSEMDRVSQSRTSTLKADGGMTKNRFLMQFMADITGCSIIAAGMEDATAEGAARAAALALGDFRAPRELPSPAKQGQTFFPKMRNEEREQRLALWRRAVERSLHWRQHSDGK